jgi:hypothetical protein
MPRSSAFASQEPPLNQRAMMRRDDAVLDSLVLQCMPAQRGGSEGREDTWLDALVIQCMQSTLGPENTNPNTGRAMRGARVPQQSPRPPGPRRPPGKCTEGRRNQLQDRVHQLCDAKRSCDEEGQKLTCKKISARSRLSKACLTAREQIMRECYDGGDANHRKEARRAAVALNKCRVIWRERDRGCEDWNRKKVERNRRSLAMFE